MNGLNGQGIFVGEVPYNTKEKAIRNLFAEYGTILDVAIRKKNVFVTYTSCDAATLCLDAYSKNRAQFFLRGSYVIVQRTRHQGPRSAIALAAEKERFGKSKQAKFQRRRDRMFHRKFKVELCKAFMAGQTCEFGDWCRFAHGKQDMNSRLGKSEALARSIQARMMLKKMREAKEEWAKIAAKTAAIKGSTIVKQISVKDIAGAAALPGAVLGAAAPLPLAAALLPLPGGARIPSKIQWSENLTPTVKIKWGENPHVSRDYPDFKRRKVCAIATLFVVTKPYATSLVATYDDGPYDD